MLASYWSLHTAPAFHPQLIKFADHPLPLGIQFGQEPSIPDAVGHA